MGDTTRAEQLRNDDSDRVCRQADGYFLGQTPEGELVIAFDVANSPQFGIFLDGPAARDFLEMQAMGFLP